MVFCLEFEFKYLESIQFMNLLVHFGALWSTLVHFGPFCSILTIFCPLLSSLVHIGPLRSTLFHFSPLKSTLVYFGPLWSNLLTSDKEEKHDNLPTTLNFAVRMGKLGMFTLKNLPLIVVVICGSGGL